MPSRYDLLVSALFPGESGLNFREMYVSNSLGLKTITRLTPKSRAMIELERLVGKYPGGFEG